MNVILQSLRVTSIDFDITSTPVHELKHPDRRKGLNHERTNFKHE